MEERVAGNWKVTSMWIGFVIGLSSRLGAEFRGCVCSRGVDWVESDVDKVMKKGKDVVFNPGGTKSVVSPAGKQRWMRNLDHHLVLELDHLNNCPSPSMIFSFFM